MNKDQAAMIEKEAERWINLQGIFQLGERENKIATAAYIAGRTLGSDEVEDYKKIIRPLLMLCEKNGKPVDGFRFRELILELKQIGKPEPIRVKCTTKTVNRAGL